MSYILLSGGLTASQSEWISIVATGMARSFDCTGLLSEHQLHTSTIDRLEESGLVLLHPSAFNHNNKRTRKALFFFSRPHFLFGLFVLPLIVNRKTLLLRLPWYFYQVLHAIWDTATLQASDSQLEPSYRQKLSATYQCFVQYYYARVHQHNGVKAAILGHKVYSTRLLKLALEDLGIPVFFHSGGVIYKSDGLSEISNKSRSRQQWLTAFPPPPPRIVMSYITDRHRGTGNYFDSSLAAQETSQSLQVAPNQVFLHVFRDSPFYQLDPERIYADYTQWFMSTISLLSCSDEEWDIRVHPSSMLWGEDVNLRISSILAKAPLPPNCRLLQPNSISNLRVFKNARRILTFNGTSALEAATFGRKPITISTSALSSYDKTLCFKPTNTHAYRDLLLCPSTSNRFSLSSDQTYLAKELQYIIDNLQSLSPLVGHLPIFRKSPTQVLADDYNAVVRSIQSSPELVSHLHSIGNLLSTGRIDFTTNYGLKSTVLPPQ